MQREAYKKGHEQFVLEIDPAQRSLRGSAELTIQPHQKLTTIRINSRQCKIIKTFVNKIEVEHTYTDPVSELALGSNTNIAHHQVYKTKYLNALRDADDGELSIKIPEECMKQMTESEAKLIGNEVFLQEDNSDLHDDPTIEKPASTSDTYAPSYAPIFVKVDFSLDDPRAGIVFVEPDEEISPHRCHHMYTTNQPLPGGTREWLPCIDKLSERCTWDMEFIVPRRMGDVTSDFDAEGPFNDENATVVVCSGEVMEQAVHPMDPSKKIVHYTLAVPTPAPFIGFAIGPFEMIKLTPAQLQEEILTGSDLDENQQQSLMAEINMMSNIYAFALPGYEEELRISCSFLMHAMHFYAQEYGSYPFSDFKLAFVEDTWGDTTSCASLAICSTSLLYQADVIDQVFETRKQLSLALARQWFGIHIIQKAWPDTWLVIGLANLMGALFIRRHFGNNEYRIRMKRDMELCCSLDINRPPLYNPALPSPLDPDDLDFLELKSPLVLYMLDKRMCKGGGTLGLSRVIPKIVVSAMSGELPQNAISTHYFMRLCRKVSGFDTKTFAEQWVYKSGCPKFSFSFNFNRKKMVVEIFMRQENTNTALTLNDNTSTSALTDGGVMNYQDFMSPLFTGNLTVRIHEADGTPYEHILEIQSASHKFEVQFNTKYKRIRRNTKRFLAKQAAAAAAVQEEEQENEDGEGGTTSVLGIIPSLGLGMPIFEDPTQRQEWGVVEWGQDEEDTSGAASAMFDWIRLDAEFEWLSVIQFEQPDYMWAAQLTKDKDVVAQHEAINALKGMPSLPTSTSLLRALMDPKCFYKIRMEAAYGLATCATPILNCVGLLQLNKMFLKRHCFPPNLSRMDIDDALPFLPAIPKPNNFSNIPDYFIQKAVVVAFSEVRNQYGLTPLKVRQFLLDLLKYNDNIGNEFSDCYYISTLISALGDSLIPEVPDAVQYDEPDGAELLEAAKYEIERFRTLDYVIPSYHNVVTTSCLKTITKLMLNNMMPIDLVKFMPYTRYGNFLDIRLTAIDSLFILAGLSDDVLTKFFLDIIKDDPCEYVSHYVARSMLAWLGLAMKDTSETPRSNFIEEFAEEDGRVVIDDDRRHMLKSAHQEFYSCVEHLRRRFESCHQLQQTLWEMINSPQSIPLDHCIRKYLLQLCEYMFKPIDVGLKVTIRVPLVPAQELGDDTSEPSTPMQSIIRIKSKPPSSSKDERETTPQKKTVHIKSEPTIYTPSPTSAVTQNTDTRSSPAIELNETGLGMAADDAKKCQRVLKKLERHRAAQAFMLPVDEVRDGAPQYYDIIKKPMDLGKIKTKLDSKMYTSFGEFEDDVRLMFNNCFVYNGPGTLIYEDCQALEKLLDKEVAQLTKPRNVTISEAPAPSLKKPSTTPPVTETKAPSASPSQDTGLGKDKKVERAKTDKEKCTVILTKTVESPHAFEFLHPVDPVKQGIPHYRNIIKNPMDLGTIKSKLKNDQYVTPQQFDDDMRLMFRNCYTFNPRDTYVYMEAEQLEKFYNVEWNAYYGRGATKPSADQSASVPVGQNAASVVPATTTAKPSKSVTVNKPATSNTNKGSSSQPDMNAANKTECERILNQLWEHELSEPFQYPVDTEALPEYSTVIKRSMDLSTVRRQLDENQYATIWDFEKDVRQILWNCYRFNDAASLLVNHAKTLETAFNQAWSASFASPDAISGEDKKIAQKAVAKLVAHHAAPLFNEPVDIDVVPDYPSVVKEPSDLRTISENIESGKITSLKQVDADIRRMFANCFAYNQADTFAYEQGKVLEKYYQNACRELRQRAKEPGPAAVKASTPTPQSKDAPSFAAKPASVETEQAPKEPKRPELDVGKLKQTLDTKMGSLVNKFMKHKAANFFLEPVDSDALNIPHYRDIIKHPMDFRTIQGKLKEGAYESLQSLADDICLIFSNCRTFNGSDHPISKNADILENLLNKDLVALRRLEDQIKSHGAAPAASATPTPPKPTPTKPTPATKPAPAVKPAPPAKKSSTPSPAKAEVRKYKPVLDDLQSHAHYYIFSAPVDPVLLGIPTYHEIIKRPMDFGTIRRKMRDSKYSDVDQLLSDCAQVFINCYTFNPADDVVYNMGKELEAEFNKLSTARGLKTIDAGASAPATVDASGSDLNTPQKRDRVEDDTEEDDSAKKARTD